MRLYIIRHAQSENNAFYAGRGTFGRRVPDPPLTPVGHQQAEHLARRLAQPVPSIATGNEQAADFGLTHLYCSLMVRAIVTASYVSETLDLPLVAWPEIHEVGGIYDYDKESDGEEKIGQPGNNRAFFTTHYPHLLLPESLGETGWWNRPAETREEMAGRAREFWNVLLERHGTSEDRVALITHGGFFQGLMTTLVNPFSGEAPQLPPEEAAAAMSPAAVNPPAVNQLSEDLPLPSHGIRRVWFDIQNTSITRIDFFDAEAVVVYHNRVDHLPVELIT